MEVEGDGEVEVIMEGEAEIMMDKELDMETTQVSLQ